MDDERFHVRARLEVIQILRSIAESGAIVSAYAGQGPDFALTTLLAVDADARQVLFELGQDESVNRKLLASDQVLCVSTCDRVKVQFYADHLERREFNGRPAFFAPLPTWVMKLQRREYFRVVTPMASPLMCQFVQIGPNVALPVHDIGLGGLCLNGSRADLILEVGTTYPGCRMDLPDFGTMFVDVEVRNFHDLLLKNGSHSRRTGLNFLRQTGTAQNQLQRYVSKLERDRHLRDAN